MIAETEAPIARTAHTSLCATSNAEDLKREGYVCWRQSELNSRLIYYALSQCDGVVMVQSTAVC